MKIKDMKVSRYTATAFIVALLAAPVAMSGCEQESGMSEEIEEAGDAIKEGAEQATEEAEQAMDNAQDEVQQ